jgi:hypothetical protein
MNRGKIRQSVKKMGFKIIMIFILSLVSTSVFSGDEESKFPNLTKFLSNVKKAGFTCSPGGLKPTEPIAAFQNGLIPNCYYINASAPYMRCMLPKAPGQTTKNNICGFYDDNQCADFRLRQDEAIVMIGWTPPMGVKYFSYRSYLHTRYYPGERKFRELFASLGDTVNNLSIKTTDEFKRPKPFYGAFTIIVCTANTESYSRIIKVLRNSGYPMKIINQDVIPFDLVNMGLGEESDTFMILNRIGPKPELNKKSLEAYRLSEPFKVYRLTPNESIPPKPFLVPRLRVRGTGDTKELNLMPALTKLRQAILDRYADYHVTEFRTDIWLSEGYNSLQTGALVYGEDRDTVYLRSQSFLLNDDPDEFVIVYGVNHAATDKASYSNFSVYGTAYKNGVCGVTDNQFICSARDYLPGCDEAKYLYVWKVRRSCPDKDDIACLEVPAGNGAHGVDLQTELFVGFRAYLEQATKVGPCATELLYDRVIKFSPKRWWNSKIPTVTQ